MGTTGVEVGIPPKLVQLENVLPFHKLSKDRNITWKFVEVEVLELAGSDNSRFSVLKIVDILSHVVSFFDMDEKKPECIAKVLQAVFLRHGLPRLIRILNSDILPIDEILNHLKIEISAFEDCINLVHQSILEFSPASSGQPFKIEPIFSTQESGSAYDYLESGWEKRDALLVWKMYVCLPEKSLLGDETQTKYTEALIKFLCNFSVNWKEWLPLLSFCMQSIVELTAKEKEASTPQNVPNYIKALVGPNEGKDVNSGSAVSPDKDASNDQLKRGRGRPKKVLTDGSSDGVQASSSSETAVSKKTHIFKLYYDQSKDGATLKRGRGRPKKDPTSPAMASNVAPEAAKRASESSNDSNKRQKTDEGVDGKEGEMSPKQGSNQLAGGAFDAGKRYSFREVLKPKGPSKFIKYFMSNCSSKRSSVPVVKTKLQKKPIPRQIPKGGSRVLIQKKLTASGDANQPSYDSETLELKDAAINLRPIPSSLVERAEKGDLRLKTLPNGACMVEEEAGNTDQSNSNTEKICEDVQKQLNSLVASVVLEVGESASSSPPPPPAKDASSSQEEITPAVDAGEEDDDDEFLDPEEGSESDGFFNPDDDDVSDDYYVNYVEGDDSAGDETFVVGESRGKKSRADPQKVKKCRRLSDMAIKCPFCLKTYVSSREELRFHLKFHKIGVSGLVCPECGRNERSWVHMSKHISKHQELKMERLKCIKLSTKRCPKCDREFSTTENLISHFQNKHDFEASNFTCSVCNENFTDGKSYILHFCSHENVTYECDKCAFVTHKKSKFESHRQSHEQNAPYTCGDCGRTFRTETGLTIHLARDKHVSKERSLCEECGCSFTSVYYLKMHNKRMHQESEKHPCPHCPYVGTLQVNLKQHIERTHIKEFQCDQCDYATKKEKSLMRHKAAFHDESRTAVCPHCGYRGPSKKHVSEHIRMQHNPALHRFACKDCPLTFKTMTQLRDHRPSHTGETPYVCRVCGYRCKYRQTMHMHVKKRHPGVTIREGIEGPRDRRDRCEKPKKSSASSKGANKAQKGQPDANQDQAKGELQEQNKVDKWIADSLLQEAPEVSVITDNTGFSVEETIAAVSSTGPTIYVDGDPLTIEQTEDGMTYKIVQEGEEVTTLEQTEGGLTYKIVQNGEEVTTLAEGESGITYKIVQDGQEVTSLNQIQEGVEILLVRLDPTQMA